MFTTRHMISFFIHGVPAPGGSKSAFVPTNKKTGEPFRGPGGRIIVNVVDAGGDRTKEWRKSVAWAGKAEWRYKPLLTGPLKVHMEFYIPRPKAHYGTGKNSLTLRSDAPEFHTHPADAIKYARSTEDALTSIIWQDDSQTVSLTTEKRWTTENQHSDNEGQPGCWIDIYEVITAKPQPSEQTLEFDLSCPAPTTTTTPKTGTTETSLGFDATKPADSPW